MTSAAHLGSRNGINIVDFHPFLNGSAAQKQEVADAILDSFKRIGFVYVLNHGMDETKLDGMFNWSKKFFDLPMEKKMLAPHPPSGTHHRGYSAPGKEKIAQDYDSDDPKQAITDVKESYEVGKEGEDMPNIWLPDEELPGFREACLDFYWACNNVQLAFLRALALGFHLDEEYFLQFHENSDSQLRLLHYPSIPASQLSSKASSRITAHSDFATITLLFQDSVGGLEVEDPHQPGVFLAAPPIPGTVIINAGDFLMRWSNDTIRSTIHRVREPTNITTDGMIPERYSIPYFCSLDYSTVVDCIPGTYSNERPKKYEPISAREYIMKRLAANY